MVTGPAVPLEGPLMEGALSGVLRNVHLGRRTGLLHIRNGPERGSVCFVSGHIVYGDTTIRECHMGDTLVRHEILSPQDLERALATMRAQGRRLGQVLVDMGVLDEERLQEALALQVRELLRCVFAWREGSYAFEERPPDAFHGHDRPLPLSTGEVILDAVWSITDPEVLRYALGSLDRVLVATTDPFLRFQRVTLTSIDGFLLTRVDGKLSAGAILQLAPVSAEEAHRSLLGLLCIGMVEYLPAARSAARERAAGEAARAHILEAYARVSSPDHFAVLGLTRSAGEAEVRAAFHRMAQEFHPEAPHQPDLADLQEKLSAIFARLVEAHRVLSDPAARAALGVSASRETSPVQAPSTPAEPAARSWASDPLLAQQQLEQVLARAEEDYAAERYMEVLQALGDDLLASVKGRLASKGRLLRARCYLKNPEWHRQAEDELKAVVREDPGNHEACFLLGTIYRAGGAMALAAGLFRRALELRPRHAEARAELAALEGAPETPAAGGLLGRFRKRT